MKTKVYSLALLVSAALITQTYAAPHGSGFGGFAGGGSHGGGYARHAAVAPAYHATAPMRTSAPNPAIYANHYATYNRVAVANRAAYAYSQRNVANVSRAHTLPSNWRNHVYARQSANWHRDWNHDRIYWWRGHPCRFINGSWFIFDVGFDPWWSWPCPGYYYGYPCGDDYGY